MKTFVVLSAVLSVAIALTIQSEESPKPYSFNYVAEGDEGTSSHTEEADGTGYVRGSYSLSDIDGRSRIVEYVAGPEGYNAVIRTNEPGTDNAAPADVKIESTSDTARALHYQAERPAQARPAAPKPKPVAYSSGDARAEARQDGSARFVLVPVDDPRARAYYGPN